MKNYVKQYRFSMRLTEKELADKIGVSKRTIINIEKEKLIPSLPLAHRLAVFFNGQIEELFVL